MLYVLDTSVLLKWLVPEDLSDKAERLIEAFRGGRAQFIAPDVIAAETGHSLRRLFNNDKLSGEAYFDAVADFLALELPVVPSAGLVARATRLVIDHRGSFYDSLYLSLAHELGCTVLTADGRMTRGFAATGRLTHLQDVDVDLI